MKRHPFAAGAAGLSILLITSGAASASATPPPAAPAQIVISAFEYSGDLTVTPGREVRVTNTDPAAPVPVFHTLTHQQTVPLFDSGAILPGGGTATFTAPSQPGSYPFGCRFHLFMQGTLVVQG